MKLRSARTVGLLGILASMPLMFTGTASALSSAQGFNISTSSGGTYAGWANVQGSVAFYDATGFDIAGTVTDRCPKDGAGAYVFVQIRNAAGTVFDDGGADYWDNNGCDSGTVKSWKGGWFPGYRIGAVRLVVKECDNIDGSLKCSSNSADIKYSTWKDNPYT